VSTERDGTVEPRDDRDGIIGSEIRLCDGAVGELGKVGASAVHSGGARQVKGRTCVGIYLIDRLVWNTKNLTQNKLCGRISYVHMRNNYVSWLGVNTFPVSHLHFTSQGRLQFAAACGGFGQKFLLREFLVATKSSNLYERN